jgi:predicted TIM-barrel fold metal-dependent hydrolase
MGLTNNKVVNELFDNKLIYSDNINELMKMGIQFEKLNQKEKLKRLIPLMEDVRDNHTYLNRINLIFRYFTHQNI